MVGCFSKGRLYLFVPKPYCRFGRCSKSSCTTCTLRFLRSVRLALVLLTTINRGTLKRKRTVLYGTSCSLIGCYLFRGSDAILFFQFSEEKLIS
ncbi:MAG: hypothetical protein FDX30_09295 [Chlorobium sp.]|nr:MAG: hypothetical protein FDX30_09295 [Chlorobium sp.]